MKEKRSVGAPPKAGIDLLRTQAWVRHLMQLSGLRTGYALEMKFEPHTARDADGIQRPKKWDAYIKGRRCPRPVEGKPYSVDLAELHYPGSRTVFESAAWRYLDGERLSIEEVNEGIFLLKPGFSFWSPGSSEPQAGVMHPFDFSCAVSLAELPSIDALLGLALLMAKAESLASEELSHAALMMYEQLQPGLLRHEVLRPVLPSLFLAIELRGRDWTHINNQTPVDRSAFSSVVQAALEAEAEGGSPLIRTRKTSWQTR